MEWIPRNHHHFMIDSENKEEGREDRAQQVAEVQPDG
jgi:hypothetical protein